MNRKWEIIKKKNGNKIRSRTGSNDMILDIIKDGRPETRQSLMRLLQDQPVQAVVDADIIYPEIASSEDAVCSFLLMTGYLIGVFISP